MTASASAHDSRPLKPRHRDRRLAFAELLASLTRTLGEQADASLMRGAFEEFLRRVVPVQSVRLRDARSRWTARESAPSAGSIALDVGATGVLEATFNPKSGLGEWDFQMLAAAAHVGALVLEIEQSRLRIVRAGLLTGARPKREDATPLIGSTPAMQALRSLVERVAATDFTVLIEGESGVGKELVARQIHELSGRRRGPFVAINCAALVETLLEAELFGIEERTATGVRGRRGKFEHADGGTLFLDEVADLSLSAQAKLLRAIQELAVERVGGHGAHRVDVRIVVATNRRLDEMVDRRLFRPDLFYRLSGVEVRVPPLRERRADVLELARHFLARHRPTRPLRLSTTAEDALAAYEWPGNVRELERLVERSVALVESDVIELSDLPPNVRGEMAAVLLPSLLRNETLRAWAARYARLVLDRCGGNKRRASQALGISYHTLTAYLKHPAHGAEAAPGTSWSPSAREPREARAAEREGEYVVSGVDPT